MQSSQIHTVWKTASAQCEVAWTVMTGYRTRLWVRGRLIVDDWMADLDAAVARAWELRAERPSLA